MTADSTGLRVLLVDDEDIIHQTIGDYLRDLKHEVESVYDGSSGVKSLTEDEYDLALVDIRMPGMDGLSLLSRVHETRPEQSVVIITGHGDMETAIQALRLGAADFLPKPIKLLDLDAVLEKASRLRALQLESRHLKEKIRGLQEAGQQKTKPRFIGDSPAIAAIRTQISQAVDGAAETILVTGETGVGKELVAKEIHFQSSASEGPLIAVNCAAMTETLVESELFGHVKGAFTGAAMDRAGYFELAEGGTLFLDEIGDLSLPAQAKMLRVLETRGVRRVGGAKEIAVDVRIVAATNASLEDRVATGDFRRDLLYRLNMFTIHVPPLRERRADINILAQHFLSEYATRNGFECAGFEETAATALRDYDYPGNGRELRNLVERAAILARGEPIRTEHLNLPGAAEAGRSLPQEDSEEARITRALDETKWNRRAAAKLLGMPYSTLRYKIQRLRIS